MSQNVFSIKAAACKVELLLKNLYVTPVYVQMQGFLLSNLPAFCSPFIGGVEKKALTRKSVSRNKGPQFLSPFPNKYQN